MTQTPLPRGRPRLSSIWTYRREPPQGVMVPASQLGVGGEEPEDGVGLMHLVFGWADARNQPEVVRDSDPGDASRFSVLDVAGQVGAECGRPTAPGEVGDVKAEFHAVSSSGLGVVGMPMVSPALAASSSAPMAWKASPQLAVALAEMG